MPRRMSQLSQTPSRITIPQAVPEQNNHQPRFHPFLKIIISISVVFLGTVGYESYQGILKYQQNAKNAAKNCLVDFTKNNCNIVNPNQVCKPLLECATSTNQHMGQWIQIILKEIEENYMLPAVGVSLLLIYRLCQLLDFDKQKKI